MKKILHITYGLARNGTETFIMNVYRAIDHSQFQFDFLLNSPTRDGFEDEVEAMGGTIYRIPAKRWKLWEYFGLYDRFFKEHAHEYAAVHFSACSLTQVIQLECAARYGIPIRVVHAHSSMTNGLHNRLLHVVHRRNIGNIATHYLACSDVAADYFYAGALRQKAVILKNGIDLTRFEYAPTIRHQMRQQLGLGDRLVVGNVSRLMPIKNHTFQLDIFAELKRLRPDAMLMFVGDGELRSELEQKAERLGIDDSVLFLGLRTDVPQLLQAIDIVLFPSLYEGLPFSLIEAQAAGLPVFTSTTVSQQVDITGNVHFLSLEQPATAWATAIAAPQKERVSVNDRIISAGYSIHDTVRQLETIYQTTF